MTVAGFGFDLEAYNAQRKAEGVFTLGTESRFDALREAEKLVRELVSQR